MKTISFMNNNSLKGRFFFLSILIQSRLDYILAMPDFFIQFLDVSGEADHFKRHFFYPYESNYIY